VPKETRQENTKREQDRELDRELEDTFPASDPPNITRVPYERRFTSEPPSNDDRAKAEGKQLGRPKIAERTERAVRAVPRKRIDLDCARSLQL
jgi:hypothetical protein